MADLSAVNRTDPPPWPEDPVERAAAAAAAGLRRPVPAETAAALELLVAGDPDPRVRAAALEAATGREAPRLPATAGAATEGRPRLTEPWFC